MTSINSIIFSIHHSTLSGVDKQLVYSPQMELRLFDLNRSAVLLSVDSYNVYKCFEQSRGRRAEGRLVPSVFSSRFSLLIAHLSSLARNPRFTPICPAPRSPPPAPCLLITSLPEQFYQHSVQRLVQPFFVSCSLEIKFVLKFHSELEG
jgi:hypothetical protein